MDSEHDWKYFVTSETPERIAEHLLRDQRRLQSGGIPSPLAAHLPKTSSREAAEIGAFLAPPARNLHPSISRLLYDNVRKQILNYVPEPVSWGLAPESGNDLEAEREPLACDPTVNHNSDIDSPGTPKSTPPAVEEIDAAIKVLKNLKDNTVGHIRVINQVIRLIQAHFDVKRDDDDSHSRTEVGLLHQRSQPWADQRYCYICRLSLAEPHRIYTSMCQPCGDFNLAGSSISLPDSLDLTSKSALVTGARINLGYHTALRMLRCGARVVVSTRYPNDAAVRYSGEMDFASWKDRLKIVGADFRTARDAFALVAATRAALSEWGVSTLDILVNNAAQTLTDSIRKEERAINLEHRYQKHADETGFLLHHRGVPQYEARIRGGTAPLALYGMPQKLLIGNGPVDQTMTLPHDVKDDGRTDLEPYFKSSWVQTLSEIPYEDVISAHAVNTFVPLILCRELLPLMGSMQNMSQEGQGKERHNKQSKPLGYIINVSSREGIFETAAEHSAKNGKHVHTNMSKAALNMITHTEAAPAWADRRVAMNSVDPGYMSAAPEMDGMFGGQRPLGWEDGAGRVLWPVARGETDGKSVWGRFLKHYGAPGPGDSTRGTTRF
ncbi:hypothetical protein BX600DRAFT_482372 [Xylariales sp. PMI_506]|nr:hypothetical protein BX600DRAFT_482372 [Xylariales sp. PMI_506]